MAKAIHQMIRVFDPEKAIDFYKRGFGLDVEGWFDFDDFTLIYLKNPENDFELELTVNKALPSTLPTSEGGLVDEVPDGMTDYETGEPIPGSQGLQTNNPGFPGYTVGGLLLSGSIMVGMVLD